MANEEAGPKSPTRAPWWRRGLAVILLIVGCVLAPISVLGIWARTSLLESDGYVETVGPLVDDPAIQEALATRVTDRLFEQVDVEDAIAGALPDRAAFVAPFVSDGLHGFVHDRGLQLVASDQFSELWKRVNRRAHAQVLAVLEGEGTETVATRQRTGRPRPATSRRPREGATRRSGHRRLRRRRGGDTVHAVRVGRAQERAVGGPAPGEGHVCAPGGLVAPDRGGGRAGSRPPPHAAVGRPRPRVLDGCRVDRVQPGRSAYLDAIEDAGRNTDAAAAAYDQVLDFLRISLRTAMVLGVVVALGAWLAGPGRLATKIRGGVAGLVRRGGDADATPTATFVHEHRVALRVAVFAVGFGILVVMSHPGPIAVLVIGILVIVALLLVEFLGRTARGDVESSVSSDSGG